MSQAAAVRSSAGGSSRISLAILAMGGQGGGVLADWIVGLAEISGLGGAVHLRAGRRSAHRGHDLLHRDGPSERRGGAGLRADAHPGRRRCRDGFGADGGRALGASRTRHAGPYHADRIHSPGARGGREAGAGRRRSRSGGRVHRDGIRRQAGHRLRHGGDGQAEKERHFVDHVRRARRCGIAAVSASGVRGRDPRWRHGR